MRKRRILLIVVGVVVLVSLGALVLWPSSREPEYGGKRLSEWVELYDDGASPQSSDSRKAGDAIRAIGTNALPYLVKWIQWEPPRLETALNSIVGKFSPNTTVYVHPVPSPDSAAVAFRALGPGAEPAIGRLTTRLLGPRPQTAARAAKALAGLGALGLPPLLEVLTNTQSTPQCLSDVVCNIGDQGSNAQQAVPALKALLTNSAWIIRFGASNSLWKIDPKALQKKGGE